MVRTNVSKDPHSSTVKRSVSLARVLKCIPSHPTNIPSRDPSKNVADRGDEKNGLLEERTELRENGEMRGIALDRNLRGVRKKQKREPAIAESRMVAQVIQHQ